MAPYLGNGGELPSTSRRRSPLKPQWCSLSTVSGLCFPSLLPASRSESPADALPDWILCPKDRRQAPVCPGGLAEGWEKGCPVGNFKPLLSESTRHMMGLRWGDKGEGERGRESGGGVGEREFINPSITGVTCQLYLPERKKGEFLSHLTLYKTKTLLKHVTRILASRLI